MEEINWKNKSSKSVIYSEGFKSNNNLLIVVIHEIVNFFAETTRTGLAKYQEGVSIEIFIEGLLFALGYFFVQLIIFSLLRCFFKNVYQAYVLRYGKFKTHWFTTVYSIDIHTFIDKSGLDAYFLLRYLKVQSLFFFGISCINLPILLPIHSRTGEENRTLDKFNMSNISSDKLTFHFVICVCVVLLFHYMIFIEVLNAKDVIESIIRKDPYQNTLLVCNNISDINNANKEFIKLGTLDKIYYVPYNYQKIYKMWKKTCQIEDTLEKVVYQIFLETFYYESPYKITNFGTIFSLKGWKFILKCYLFHQKTSIVRIKSMIERRKINEDVISKDPVDKFQQNRYTYLSELIKLYNHMVETFESYQSEQDLEPDKTIPNVAILQFRSAFEANLYKRLVNTDSAKTCAFQGIRPYDIIWSNIIDQYKFFKVIKSSLAYSLSICVIIGWVIPVAAVAFLSRIPYLEYLFQKSENLLLGSKMLNKVIILIIPIISLILLTEGVPFIFRYFSYLKGHYSGNSIEVDVQRWFFAFLFVHLFLVVTISSGISSMIENILNNPINFPTLLAQELPKSSNFFCSFVIIRGIAYSGGNFLNTRQLVCEIFHRIFILSPPHKILRRTIGPSAFQWGSIYPIFSTLGCITLVYSIISPLILPLTSVSFIFVIFSFKYLLMYQYNTENKSETFGKLYLQGLLQLYAGLYFLELCLLGLFSITNRYDLVVGMLILIFFTVVFHYKVVNISSFECSFVGSKGGKPKNTNNVEETMKSFKESQYQEYRLPKVDCKRNLKKIWIPYDNHMIARKQEKDLFSRFGLLCNIDKCGINDEGSIYFYI